jgi:hypothetical protein
MLADELLMFRSISTQRGAHESVIGSAEKRPSKCKLTKNSRIIHEMDFREPSKDISVLSVPLTFFSFEVETLNLV